MTKQNYLTTFLMLILFILNGENSFSISSANQNSKQFVVVIDPGHGGKDPGAVNKSIREKDVVLGVGLKLGKLISETYPDVKVIFTRHTDVFIPLIDRSRIANKSKADLFISLHANFCGTPSTRGTETFALGLSRLKENLEVAQKENSVIELEDDYTTTYEGFDPNSTISNIIFENMQETYLNQSISFADAIQHQFKLNSETTDRGPKQAGFLVLRMSSMPSVLVETGFLSNPTEANFLNSDDGQQHIALSILEAFRKFKNKNSVQESNKTTEVIASKEKSNDVSPKKEIQNENKKPEESVVSTKIAEKENIVVTTDTTKKVKNTENNVFYSVQIGANTTPVETTPANFKGLKNVRREKTDKYYRYYLGNESNIDKVKSDLQQIKLKFPQAFIVSFVNGNRVPLNIGSK